jgi:hypothetical protein
VASPTEDSAVVVAAEIQDSQTAKRAFGSDAVADSVSDADATHTAGTTVVKAPKLLKQIFSKGPTSQPYNEVDKTRAVYTCLLTFSERCLSPKRFVKLRALL